MKRILRIIVASLVLYFVWVVGAIIYGEMHRAVNMKMILFAVSLVYVFILWRLWKSLIKAARKEHEEKKNGGV